MKQDHDNKPEAQLLSVIDWAAWAPGLTKKEDWLSWSENPVIPSGNAEIKPTSIPADIRRRCSHLSKMALEVSTQMLMSHSVDYAVFCSQHGELKRTVGLLQDIAAKEILSPMSFAQSVHNIAAGLFSVIHKLQQNMTSIAAGDSTFLMGMIETVTWLKLNPGKVVLLTMFDQYIPDEYEALNIQSNYEYAVALLLTNNLTSTPAISLTLVYTKRHVLKKELPLALEFLAWLLQPQEQELTQSTGEQILRWCKKKC